MITTNSNIIEHTQPSTSSNNNNFSLTFNNFNYPLNTNLNNVNSQNSNSNSLKQLDTFRHNDRAQGFGQRQRENLDNNPRDNTTRKGVTEDGRNKRALLLQWNPNGYYAHYEEFRHLQALVSSISPTILDLRTGNSIKARPNHEAERL